MFTNDTVKNEWRNFSSVGMSAFITTEQYGDTLRVSIMDRALDTQQNTVCRNIEAVATEYYQGLQKPCESTFAGAAKNILVSDCSPFRKIQRIASEAFEGLNRAKPDIKFFVYLPPSSERVNDALWEAPLTFKDGRFVLNGNDWVQHNAVSSHIVKGQQQFEQASLSLENF